MNDLERRCRRLLRAYPADYRAARGDEIIATLLEAAPAGRTRPRPREAAALLAGGLKVRAVQNRRLSAPANLLLAVILGLAISVGFITAWWVGVAAELSGPGPRFDEIRYGSPGYAIFAAALTVVAITLIWFAPRYVSVPALGLSALAHLHPLWGPGLIVAVGVGVLALLTALSRARPPRYWLCWFAVLPAWELARSLYSHPVLASFPAPLILLVAALLWIVVDARIALACAVVVGLYGLLTGAVLLDSSGWLVLGVVAVLAVPALLRIRRQAVL
jgi:hypothetical protein